MIIVVLLIIRIFYIKGLLFLDLIWAEWKRGSGARLVSPYFPDLNHTDGCLQMKFLSWGHGIIEMFVIQQDFENRCIWQYPNHNYNYVNPNKYWQTVEIPVTVHGHSPRFFVEISLFYYKLGFVAIDWFRLSYQRCSVPYNLGNKPGHSLRCLL